MKLLITVLMLFGAFVSQAQQNEEYIELVASAVHADIKELMYSKLDLTSEQKNEFEPLFNDYIDEDSKLAIERLTIFEAYAKRLDTYSLDQFDQFNKNLLNNEIDKAQVNKKYYKKFVKTIGVKETTKFFYVKKYLDNLIDGTKLDLLS